MRALAFEGAEKGLHRLKPVPPVLLCTLAVFLCGCTLGPNYKRPSVAAPGQYRGAPAASQASLADTRWPDLFPDETLKRLIAAALAHNFDLAMATERVEEARARYRIAGAAQYPFVYAEEQAGAVRYSSIGSSVEAGASLPTNVTYTQTGIALSWELDLWGRIRRLKESGSSATAGRLTSIRSGIFWRGIPFRTSCWTPKRMRQHIS